MIKIAICDDEEIILEILQRLVEQGLKKIGAEGEITVYNSGKALLEQTEEFEILFLDIEMPGMDGIELGKRLQNQKNNCKIIMATSRIERFKEAFQINAFRFVTKPFEEEEIYEALQDAISALGGAGTIEVYKDRMKCMISQRNILYMEAVDSSVEFVLEEGVYRKETSLADLEKTLDSNIFFRINRHYIVNMAKVKNQGKGNILIAGKEMKISQRKRADFSVKYREFMA